MLKWLSDDSYTFRSICRNTGEQHEQTRTSIIDPYICERAVSHHPVFARTFAHIRNHRYSVNVCAQFVEMCRAKRGRSITICVRYQLKVPIAAQLFKFHISSLIAWTMSISQTKWPIKYETPSKRLGRDVLFGLRPPTK